MAVSVWKICAYRPRIAIVRAISRQDQHRGELPCRTGAHGAYEIQAEPIRQVHVRDDQVDRLVPSRAILEEPLGRRDRPGREVRPSNPRPWNTSLTIAASAGSSSTYMIVDATHSSAARASPPRQSAPRTRPTVERETAAGYFAP
jgi:hypothetical protein